ncbi:YggS family pyridoxal phosphate enzyme, partial [Mycobacterium sp. ITM-2017-0098]
MTAEREAQLRDALASVRARLERAAIDAGRDVDDVELLPVTKFFPADDVAALHRLGCTAFAESRDQEAAAKVEDVGRLIGGDPVRWHMVGRIQRNKARSVAGWAYAAHSVDSAKVIAALDRGAVEALEEGRRAEPLRVYLQISLDGDESRGGVDVNDQERIDEL